MLFIIDDVANLKRFYKEGEQITLVSESTLDIAPIYIHSKYLPDYMINGVVVRVIKSNHD